MKKKTVSLLLAAALAVGGLAGCSKTADGGSADAAKETNAGTDTKAGTTTGSKEREKIVFWYFHTGDEGKVFENAAAVFNESQDAYEVEALSVSDKQKYIVAISGNESPDVIEISNQDVISYASNGLLENLGDMASQTGFEAEGLFSQQAMESNTLDGGVFGLPLTSVVIQMFYNEDILKELGYDGPPKTMEELYEMAVAATQLDDSGTITRLGYPLFPLASARQELIYAFGGTWWEEDGVTLTLQSQGVLDSLKVNVEYREKYGVQKVQEFIATANTNRYTENDMFFAGKQLFRFDGPWLAAMISQYGSDINYGVTMIPGTKAHPEDRGSSRYETTAFGIPVVAKEKTGAWEFVKFLTASDYTKEILMGIGSLPARLDLYEDGDMLAQPNFKAFIEALKTENGIQYAKIPDLAKYTSLIEEYLDYVYNGMKTPEDAMAELAEQTKMLD